MKKIILLISAGVLLATSGHSWATYTPLQLTATELEFLKSGSYVATDGMNVPVSPKANFNNFLYRSPAGLVAEPLATASATGVIKKSMAVLTRGVPVVTVGLGLYMVYKDLQEVAGDKNKFPGLHNAAYAQRSDCTNVHKGGYLRGCWVIECGPGCGQSANAVYDSNGVACNAGVYVESRMAPFSYSCGTYPNITYYGEARDYKEYQLVGTPTITEIPRPISEFKDMISDPTTGAVKSQYNAEIADAMKSRPDKVSVQNNDAPAVAEALLKETQRILEDAKQAAQSARTAAENAAYRNYSTTKSSEAFADWQRTKADNADKNADEVEESVATPSDQPANTYDPTLAAPEKKSVPTLLETIYASAPVAGIIGAFTFNASGSCSEPFFEAYGQTYQFDMCPYSSQVALVGTVVLAFAHLAALFIIFGKKPAGGD